MTTTQRLNYYKAAPEPFNILLTLEKHLHSALEPKLLHLVKLRTSQMNGCAYCIDMHWKDARAAGDSEQRLYGLNAWRESPYYTERERAAFAWTESLTLIPTTRGIGGDPAPDADFAAVREHFTDAELANLTWAIGAINAWNRVAIAFRSTPGLYKPAAAAAS